MSNILTDMKIKENIKDTELTKTRLQNGNIALCLRLLKTDCQVIIKEFRGDYQYRRFLYEAVLLRSSLSPNWKDINKIAVILSNLTNFLREKDKLNHEKIV